MLVKAEQICWVPLSGIDFSEEELLEGEEILLVYQGNGRYRLLSGKNRLEEITQSGAGFVEAAISDGEDVDQRLSALCDLLAQGKMHFLKEGQAYHDLVEKDGLTVQQISLRIGRSVGTIRKKMRLMNLGQEIMDMVEDNGISEAIAEVMLRIPGQQGRQRVLQHVINEGLDARATEALVDEMLSRMPVPVQTGRRMKPLMRDYRLYVNAFREIVQQMKDAGLDAQMQVNQGHSVVDIRVSIPVFMGRKR